MKTLRISSMLMIAAFTAIATLSSKAQVLDEQPPLDNFYEKVNTQGREPKPYVWVREADVYQKKRIWRMIDFREKMNQYLYYPMQPVQDRTSFMSMVVEAVKEGKITLYDAMTDDFTKPLTYEEFISQNTQISEREVEDFDNPGEFIKRIDTSDFKTEDVKILRVKEDWFIDKQRSMRDVRILGLCPVIQMADDEGNFKGYKPLFWLYYSNCRGVFASTESFNRHNSAMRMSYDDVFAFKRFFNSYIIKEDNQQDRQISEYAQGMAAIAEAERIKEELFEMEDNLWEY